jgi:hypothetical protein
MGRCASRVFLRQRGVCLTHGIEEDESPASGVGCLRKPAHRPNHGGLTGHRDGMAEYSAGGRASSRHALRIDGANVLWAPDACSAKVGGKEPSEDSWIGPAAPH